MRRYNGLLFLALLTISACHSHQPTFDASGSFEADEVIVSAELGGQLLNFQIDEGDFLKKGQAVGNIDSTNVALQKEQVESSIEALAEKTSDVRPQIALYQDQLSVQRSQLNNLLYEKERIERLVKADAATGKQLDDINAQIDVVRKQMEVTQQQINVQKSNIHTQNKGILSERSPLQKKVAELNHQLSKAQVINPINGTVLTKYAEQGEVTAPGKALYKLADLSYLTLRVYVTGSQLPQIKLNQQVTVFIDDGAQGYRRYPGTITWISDKAEFTPKNIQTKEERANLVYAIKVKVKNDGYLKIGMYAEVNFQNTK